MEKLSVSSIVLIFFTFTMTSSSRHPYVPSADIKVK